MNWLNDTRVERVVTLIVAFGVAYTPIATLIAAKVQRPAPSSPRWQRFLYDFLVDVPAWCAAAGRVGAFGGRGNLPLVPSRTPHENPPRRNGIHKEPPSPPPLPPPPVLPPIALLIFCGMFAQGCYCWNAERRQEPVCVVVHQVVDCTVDAFQSVRGYIRPILDLLISTGKFDLAAIDDFIKVVGFRNASCAMAILENDIATNKAAGPMRQEMIMTRISWDTWRQQNQPDVKFKIAPGVIR